MSGISAVCSHLRLGAQKAGWSGACWWWVTWLTVGYLGCDLAALFHLGILTVSVFTSFPFTSLFSEEKRLRFPTLFYCLACRVIAWHPSGSQVVQAGWGLNPQVHVHLITMFSVWCTSKKETSNFSPHWGWAVAWWHWSGKEIWWSVSQEQLSSNLLSGPPHFTSTLRQPLSPIPVLQVDWRPVFFPHYQPIFSFLHSIRQAATWPSAFQPPYFTAVLFSPSLPVLVHVCHKNLLSDIFLVSGMSEST